jgi:hypothetical protein
MRDVPARQVGCIFYFIARLNNFNPDTWVSHPPHAQ